MNIVVWIIIASIVLAFSFENRRLREEVRLLRIEIARRDSVIHLPDTISKEAWERALNSKDDSKEKWGAVMVIGRE